MTMRLESVQNALTTELRKVDNSKKENISSKLSAYTRKADKTSLSSDAKNIDESKVSASVVAARIQAEPDIRQDKINDIRRKLDDGFYNTSKFAGQLADKLISDFGL